MEFIRELDAQEGQTKCLVRKGEQYYVVSSVSSAFDTGAPETLVFPADEDGEVTIWIDVAGGSYVTREEAIEELDTGDRSPRPGFLGAMYDALVDEDEEE